MKPRLVQISIFGQIDTDGEETQDIAMREVEVEIPEGTKFDISALTAVRDVLLQSARQMLERVAKHTCPRGCRYLNPARPDGCTVWPATIDVGGCIDYEPRTPSTGGVHDKEEP